MEVDYSKLMEVDYSKLSEQYGNFLIAIGGVSITILTVILTFSSKKKNFSLVAALIVSTISCFTGAHMMAETAAFISKYKDISSGERLFLLASTNIFIAVVLVVFALMLLPMISRRVDIPSIKPISYSVFIFVIIAVLNSVILSYYRMPAPQGGTPILIALVIGLALSGILLSRLKDKKLCKKTFLRWSFISISFFTLFLFGWFGWTFPYTVKNGGKVWNTDVYLFSLAITSTCALLGVAATQPFYDE
jgi:uncharacterized membrane protein